MKLKATLLAASMAVAGVSAPAETLDVASTFPKNLTFLGEGAEVLAKNI